MNKSHHNSIVDNLIVDITFDMTAWSSDWNLHYNSLEAGDLVCPKDIAKTFLSEFFDNPDYKQTLYVATTPKFQEAFDNLKRTTFALDIDRCLTLESLLTQEDKALLAGMNVDTGYFDPETSEMITSRRKRYEEIIGENYKTFCCSVEEELLVAINIISNHLFEIHGRHLEMFQHFDQVLKQDESKKRRRSEGNPRSRLDHLKLKKIHQVHRYYFFRRVLNHQVHKVSERVVFWSRISPLRFCPHFP
jgi:hypothetical protein